MLAACAAAVLAAAAPAGAKTHAVSGKQIVVDEETGIYKMRGSLIGGWAATSFEEVEVRRSITLAEPSVQGLHGPAP